ncbi:arylsulfatase B-like [Branchiostoma lanceolatum]|uniref:ARSJ protein n=1 Tax=Branchiostoma lanceolatum TaxID=7740 RepID=A0A8K0EUB6_BRALA|nr:ARSJ [Branchiostoma lanceolatum]
MTRSTTCGVLGLFFHRLLSLTPRLLFATAALVLLLVLMFSIYPFTGIIDNFDAFYYIKSYREETADSSGTKPNIVFILADDYGWNDIGYHGSLIQTPNLDSLATEGVKLENYYVQPICTPSRCQLMTGRYQIHYGLQHGAISPPQPSGLPLSEITIAERLKESGYSTHIVGKWHLGFYKKEYTPTYRGFDTFYGFYNGAGDYYTHRRTGAMPSIPTRPKWDGHDLRDQEKPVFDQNGTYSTYLFAKKTSEIISRHDRNKPLFLYLPFQAVHSPLQAPVKYIEMNSHINDTRRRLYAALTSAMDEAVANITIALKQKGLWKNTILIFSTDNGGWPKSGGNNWPLRGAKGGLWEGGVRGVGFVSSPLLKKKGRTSDALIHISDWFPTLVGLAGGSLKETKSLDGYDVWKAISEGKSSSRKEILHNIDPLFRTLNKWPGDNWYDKIFNTSVHAAIRSGDWKLLTGIPGKGYWLPPPSSKKPIENPKDQADKMLRLFNIRQDPQERTDLSESYPLIVQELLEKLSAYNQTAISPFYPDGDPRANPALHGGLWSPWE